MAFIDIFKVSFKTYFNPRAWIGYNELTYYNKVFSAILKSVFTSAKPDRTESFDAAMARLGLTEETIQKTAQLYLTYTTIFIVLAGLSFSGSLIMLLHYKTVAGWILALMVTALFLVQAFRFHFWHFQIKWRKLGCTYQEWRQGKPNDGVPSE